MHQEQTTGISFFFFLISIKKRRIEVSPENTSSIHQGQNTTQAHKVQKSIKP